MFASGENRHRSTQSCSHPDSDHHQRHRQVRTRRTRLCHPIDPILLHVRDPQRQVLYRWSTRTTDPFWFITTKRNRQNSKRLRLPLGMAESGRSRDSLKECCRVVRLRFLGRRIRRIPEPPSYHKAIPSVGIAPRRSPAELVYMYVDTRIMHFEVRQSSQASRTH